MRPKKRLDIIGADRGEVVFLYRMFDVIQEGESLQRIGAKDADVGNGEGE